jgi:hypothetical protein
MIVDTYLALNGVMAHDVPTPWRLGPEWREELVGTGHGQLGAEAVRMITPVAEAVGISKCSFSGSGPDGCQSVTRNLLRSGI